MIVSNIALLMAVPVGALISLLWLGSNNPQLAGIALAFSAGTFLHISLSDLLPEVHRHSAIKNQAIFFFILGLACMFGLAQYLKV